jgi:hypothetical protein
LRGPLSLERIHWTPGSKTLFYQGKASHDDPFASDPQGETLDIFEFLARVLSQIPEPRKHGAHYFGAYSSRAKALLKPQDLELAAAPSLTPSSHTEQTRPDSMQRAALRKTMGKSHQKSFPDRPSPLPVRRKISGRFFHPRPQSDSHHSRPSPKAEGSLSSSSYTLFLDRPLRRAQSLNRAVSFGPPASPAASFGRSRARFHQSARCLNPLPPHAAHGSPRFYFVENDDISYTSMAGQADRNAQHVMCRMAFVCRKPSAMP